MLERISGDMSRTSRPTDMGVNMAGLAISDDEACREAGNNEIVRRYFQTAEEIKRTGVGEEALKKIELLMNQAGITQNLSPARSRGAAEGGDDRRPRRRHGAARRARGHGQDGQPARCGLGAAHERAQGRLGGRRRAVRHLRRRAGAHLPPEDRAPAAATTRACTPTRRCWRCPSPRCTTRWRPRLIDNADKLRGCDAYFSVIISAADEKLYKTLGINVCCEPKYEQHRYYHK